MKKDLEEEKKSKLNNLDLRINRGFELMLNSTKGRSISSKPKTFQIHFGKILSFISREIHINFDFSFNVLKK
jgi:hypothetical protein